MPPSPPPGPGHHWPPPAPRSVWGPPPGPGRPPVRPALNGFALASLLVGLLCLPPLGIVFAVVALVQIAGRGQRGKALAVTGLVLSVVMTGVVALTASRVAGAVGERLDRAGAAAGSAEGVRTDIEDLRTGDCFNVPGGDLASRRPRMYTVDCAQAHHAEVTSSGHFDPGAAPGSQEAMDEAETECWKAQDAYAMDTWALPPEAEMFYYAPSRATWRQGDRQLLCVLGTTEPGRPGSLRRDGGVLTPTQISFLKVANAADMVLSRPPMTGGARELADHQAWARTAYAALGDELKLLEKDRSLPGMEQAVDARLREVAAARTAWMRASQSPAQADFDRQRERAEGALTVATERALRGAYGLSTTVPWWLEGSEQGADGGPGRGPAFEQA
ncbi:DUF4190 domain-containing protein [Streptomyces sp. cmx-4-9]|uniref:DUF4190 domain-containing protein n=1 Tax=Streptomyces sp. cmx-4-9 TaxID=2790941 RepID=UPI003980E746